MREEKWKLLWFEVLFITLVIILITGVLLAGRKHSNVEDIGNRDINGRVMWFFPNFVSLEDEIKIGHQYAQMLEQTAKIVEDPVVNEYINKVGQNIVINSDAKVPFYIKVIDTDEVNAFALPGGYFYINKGLIFAAETESELVGVMAHEIAHVTARHATERMTKTQVLQFASIPLLFVGGYWTQYAIYQGLGMGLSLAVLGITRESEEEADQLGVQYAWNSGYDPEGFISFFEKLKEKEKDSPGKFASWFRTHPPVDDRIAKTTAEMRVLPPLKEYKITTSEFQRVKGRLVELENNIPLTGRNTGTPKRPTLKRKTSTQKKAKEKPTLKGGKKGE